MCWNVNTVNWGILVEFIIILLDLINSRVSARNVWVRRLQCNHSHACATAFSANTRAGTMFFTIYYAGPTLIQHCLGISCLLVLLFARKLYQFVWSSPLGWHQFSFLIPYWSSVSHESCFYFFQNFPIFTNILINLCMNPEETQTNYLYTWRTIECSHSIGPQADGIGPALGRQSVLQVCPPVSWLWDTN